MRAGSRRTRRPPPRCRSARDGWFASREPSLQRSVHLDVLAEPTQARDANAIAAADEPAEAPRADGVATSLEADRPRRCIRLSVRPRELDRRVAHRALLQVDLEAQPACSVELLGLPPQRRSAEARGACVGLRA